MTFDDRMRLARAAEDAGDADEAYEQYTKALELDARRPEAWLGRARASAPRSPRSFRLEDVSASIDRAIECAPSDRADDVSRTGAALLRDIASARHQANKQILADYVSTRGEWGRHLERCASVVRALERAHALDRGDPLVLEKIIEVCAAQIEGVVYNDVGDYQVVTQRRRGVTEKYEAELRGKIADCAVKLRALRPGYVPPEAKKTQLDLKGGCFVVTAAMGDPDHPDVVTIRRWRDETLARTAVGRLLVSAYQVVGPPAADVVRRSPVLRKLSRTLLVVPLAAVLRRFS